MALPSAGALSLNAIHVEAGGSSGTSASINDSDIRGLISKGSGVQMTFREWYGASSQLWATTMTTGVISGKGLQLHGFNSSMGSLSDTTVDFLSGSACTSIQWNGGTSTVSFGVTGSHSSTSFTTMTVASTAFNRSDSSYSFGSNTSVWTWSSISTNPFGSSGDTRAIVFT